MLCPSIDNPMILDKSFRQECQKVRITTSQARIIPELHSANHSIESVTQGGAPEIDKPNTNLTNGAYCTFEEFLQEKHQLKMISL